MARTTFVLEDACMRGVRDLARREHRQLSQVVNELLSDGLRRRTNQRREPFELPTFKMGEVGVNLADRDAIEAVLNKPWRA